MDQPLLNEKLALSLNGAKRIAQGAAEASAAAGVPIVIAIVDDGGNLLYLERLEGAPAGSVEVAFRKAKSAVAFKSETRGFESGLAGGALGLLSLDLVPFDGGVPVSVKGAIVGAIGVSGASSTQDGDIARKGVEKFMAAL
jgi:glc operon protein GlcG